MTRRPGMAMGFCIAVLVLAIGGFAVEKWLDYQHEAAVNEVIREHNEAMQRGRLENLSLAATHTRNVTQVKLTMNQPASMLDRDDGWNMLVEIAQPLQMGRAAYIVLDDAVLVNVMTTNVTTAEWNDHRGNASNISATWFFDIVPGLNGLGQAQWAHLDGLVVFDFDAKEGGASIMFDPIGGAWYRVTCDGTLTPLLDADERAAYYTTIVTLGEGCR